MRFRFTIRGLLFATAFVTSCIALFLGSIGWDFDGRYRVRQIRFEPAKWRQADLSNLNVNQGGRTIRSNMIEDLLLRYKFNGWTRQQVIDLLGPPTENWAGFVPTGMMVFAWTALLIMSLRKSTS